ncbi:MAG: DUF1552 domain-containing protein [Opitutaceae bacterium]
MKKLSRRTFLKGAGTVIALPYLDAMIPAFARAGETLQSPVRMIHVYAPSGMIEPAWYPKTTGRDFEFQRIMKPLEKLREDVLVVSGLSAYEVGAGLADGGGDHARAVATYLTGVRIKKTQGADFHAGVSADQIAARVLGAKTKFPSLELTCEDSRTIGECDGHTCAYQTLSWKSSTEPLPPEMNPRILFERMFGNGNVSADPVERKNREFYRRSILDLTLQDTQSLKRELGAGDRRKLDEYFTSVRELELRMERQENDQHSVPPGVAKPMGIPATYADHARLMFDLLVLALQTDMTRVSTFMMAREGGVRPYPEIGVPEAHHSISHHRDEPELIEKVTKIECYHMEQFAYFVERLKAMPEGAGTLLDNCVIAYGAAMGDPNRHDHNLCPTVIAGKGGGKIRTGRHVAYKEGTPLANLHLTMLDVAGVPTDKLGNADGKLDFLSDV